MEKDRSGAPERSEDEKLGQAISQAMREITKHKADEKKTPPPGTILPRYR